ncbi:MAG: VCBS repeat-containing protein, partial [Gemmataceae bacterium]|nr:VCBS repeat-containing protein [Gemmataceae bacterium]MDW8267430.1 choice-of-anchor Q domain-containing protein [Gemmataceae bacterium]
VRNSILAENLVEADVDDYAIGGGIAHISGQGLTLIDTFVERNVASVEHNGGADAGGGGIYAEAPWLHIHNTSIGSGGIIENSVFGGNESAANASGGDALGGGVLFLGAFVDDIPQVTISHGRFLRNRVHGGFAWAPEGDDSYSSAGDAWGGGLLVLQNEAPNRVTVRLVESIFENNRAFGGSSAFGVDSRGGLAAGAGVGLNGVLAFITGGAFSDNAAVAGSSLVSHLGTTQAGSAYGGGLHVGDLLGDDPRSNFLVVEDVVFTNNSATGGNTSGLASVHRAGRAFGGGMFVSDNKEALEVSIDNTAFRQNRATGGIAGGNATEFGSGGDAYGGALAVFPGSGQDSVDSVFIFQSEFSSNEASGGRALREVRKPEGGFAFGGAIALAGTNAFLFSLRNSTVQNNAARGGQVEALAPPDGVFAGSAYGGGIYLEGGGGSASGFVERSTLAGNQALGGRLFGDNFGNNVQAIGGDAHGGGLLNNIDGTLEVINSTVSGNLARGGDAQMDNNMGQVKAGSGLGGGIYSETSGVSRLVNVTVTQNAAFRGTAQGPNTSPGEGRGGGLVNDAAAERFRVWNTIVAANTASDPNSPDLLYSFITEGNNLIGASDGSNGFTDGVNGDQVGTLASPINPLLGPLQFNGGPTRTHALLSGSPALNAGNSSVANAPYNLQTDQRGPGYARLSGPAVDIGAYEHQERIFATGAGEGGGSHVRVFRATSGVELFSFFAYPGFHGGVRVATGDVTGDGTEDIITGAGPGGGPHVKVFDGKTGAEIASFFAFDPSFSGGIFVGVGDFETDNDLEVIVGAGPGGGPHVRVFNIAGGTGTPIAGALGSFYAYHPSFTGGVTVAAGNFDGLPGDELITGAGPGGGPHVKAFRSDGTLVASFFAYAPSYTGGVFVAADDLDGDGQAEIITGLFGGTGVTAEVRIFNGGDAVWEASFTAYPPTFYGGVRVATVDRDHDGLPDILTGPGSLARASLYPKINFGGTMLVQPGTPVGPLVRLLDGVTLGQLDSFFAYDPAFHGGVFVG